MNFQFHERNTNHTKVTQGNRLDTRKKHSIIQNNSNKRKIAPCKIADLFLLQNQTKDPGSVTFQNAFCKTYRCPYCGPRKIGLFIRATTLAMEKFNLRVFATLTLDHKTVTPKESKAFIRSAWNKFRVIQKRDFPNQKLNFISVVELQKSGHAHLHILFSNFIDSDWLKKAWSSVGGGYTDIRRANLSAARYLAKYLGKSLSDSKKGRAFSTSQEIKLRKLLNEAINSENSKSGKFEFSKVREKDARNILKNNIVEEIVDKKGHSTGFVSNKSLPKVLQHHVTNER